MKTALKTLYTRSHNFSSSRRKQLHRSKSDAMY